MRRQGLSATPAAAIFLLLSATTASSIAWSADDTLTAALQARYGAMKEAIAAHDGKAIGAILAPDFESIDVAGQTEAAPQMIADVNGLKPDPDKSSETTLISVTPTENAVTVEQRYVMKTVRISADGAKHDVQLVTVSTDTWIKPAEAWLIERTVTDELSYVVDGKLIVHKVKP